MKSLPKVTFPTVSTGFSLSTNIKHYSNTQEVLKHFKKKLSFHTSKLKIKKNGNPDQFALLTWELFRDQKTGEVISLLRENKIVYKYVPNNMTADFQVLDLTVNKWLKGIMMDKFNKLFAEILRKELDEGKILDEISLKFKLMAITNLHVKWVIDVFNQLSSFDGKKVVFAGWEASGISDALERDLAGFSGSFVDLCYEIDPFDQGDVHFNITSEMDSASEEFVEKERISAAIDDDDNNDGEFLPGAISSSDDSEEENDQEIENN